MPYLSCKYMGLDLCSPLIMNISGLSDKIEVLKELQDCGAGAIRLKSLFEEEIDFQEGRIIDLEPLSCPEADDYRKYYSRENSVIDYIKIIKTAKKEISIPVIASINCIGPGDWINCLKEIELAGADAIELEVFLFPDDKDFKAEDYERILFDVVTKVAFTTKIPLTVNLSPYFTNLIYIVDQLFYRGVNNIILINRKILPDIDIGLLEYKSTDIVITSLDFFYTLRSISTISSHFNKIEIAASCGIYNSETIIKLLLAGASATIVNAASYKNDFSKLKEIMSGVLKWMDYQGFNKIENFQGQINYSIFKDRFLFERSQYMKYFSV